MADLKPYDCGLICGRFQTFHIGHESWNIWKDIL